MTETSTHDPNYSAMRCSCGFAPKAGSRERVTLNQHILRERRKAAREQVSRP